MIDEIKAEDIEAAVSTTSEPHSELCSDDRPEQQGNADSTQADLPPAFELIATAYNANGQRPHCVVEFDHPSSRRVHRLLPVHTLMSDKRARDALIKAGMPSPIAFATTTLTAIANDPPAITGLYDVPHGWGESCDFGTTYRYGNAAFSSSGPIPVYADGPVPEPQQTGDIGKLTDALGADPSPATVILVAAHLASLLVHLLDYAPLVITASGAEAPEAERLVALADLTFGTRRTALHARRSNTDESLIQFVITKSRKQAFAHAQTLLDRDATATGRDRKAHRTHAPVTLILTAEADVPGNLASPTPPPGCIEIHLDALSSDAPTATQARLDTAMIHATAFVAAYIEAVLRGQDAVVRNADNKLPKFVERYLSLTKGVRSENTVHAAAHAFALLRYALTCGRQFSVIPWSAEIVDAAVDACVKQWATRHRERETAFERHVIDAVKKLLNTGNSPNQRARFNDREVRLKSIGGHELMLIDSATFDVSVVGHLDKAHVLSALRKRRLLVTNGDGAQYQVRTDGGRARFYAFDTAALRAM